MSSPQAAGTAGSPTQHTPNQGGGLDVLRAPFPESQIQALPKILCGACSRSSTKNCDRHNKAKCPGCGNFITTSHLHLDYVGHAELTARLLDADLLWTWEPQALDNDGLPKFDSNGGLWIRLTVCGHTRLGYGDSQGKSGPNAVKEAIGDALRNAAMRFGAALDLWAKSDLRETQAAHPKEAPSLAEVIVERIRSKDADGDAVWNNPVTLTDLRKEAVVGGVGHHMVPGAGKTLEDLIDNRLAEMERISAERAAARAAAAAQAPAAAAQVAAEHPAGRPDTARANRLIAQGRQHWSDRDVLTQIDGEVTAHQLDAFPTEDPFGNPTTLGKLVAGRLAELAHIPAQSTNAQQGAA